MPSMESSPWGRGLWGRDHDIDCSQETLKVSYSVINNELKNELAAINVVRSLQTLLFPVV